MDHLVPALQLVRLSREREIAMSIEEILKSCAHEKVAQAAVASLGGAFANKVKAVAAPQGLSVGAYTACVVRRFSMQAGPRERQALQQAMQGTDQPILIGLRHILLPVIEAGAKCGREDESERLHRYG